MIYLYVFLGLLVLLLFVIVVRALLFKEKTEKVDIVKHNVDEVKVATNLGKLIKHKTISTLNDENTNYQEFDKFIEEIKETYPTLFKKAEYDKASDYGLMFKIEGRKSSSPTILMAHYDVVPVDVTKWKHDPFLGEIIDGYVYGRGALDTKITVLSILESINMALENDYIPKNDLYLCLGSNEEVFGKSAYNRVIRFKSQEIIPSLVLDEGGAITEKLLPSVNKKGAVIGITEKGMANITLSVDTNGGHSSTPKRNSSISKLAKAINRLEAKPMPAKITKLNQDMLEALGKNANFLMKIIFANMWLFKGLIKMIFISNPETNALIRTTFAFTIIKGGEATNTIPPHCEVNVNVRISPFDTIEKIVDYMKKTINDSDVKIEIKECINPSKESNYSNDSYNTLKLAIKETFGDVMCVPYTMLGGTDSKHYMQITDCVYRFSPVEMNKVERSLVHGIDERVKTYSVKKAVEFYLNLLNRI